MQMQDRYNKIKHRQQEHQAMQREQQQLYERTMEYYTSQLQIQHRILDARRDHSNVHRNDELYGAPQSPAGDKNSIDINEAAESMIVMRDS